MSRIFGISSLKVNLFPSLKPYCAPEPVCLKLMPFHGINNSELRNSIQAYVENSNNVRYRFKEALRQKKFIKRF